MNNYGMRQSQFFDLWKGYVFFLDTSSAMINRSKIKIKNKKKFEFVKKNTSLSQMETKGPTRG